MPVSAWQALRAIIWLTVASSLRGSKYLDNGVKTGVEALGQRFGVKVWR